MKKRDLLVRRGNSGGVVRAATVSVYTVVTRSSARIAFSIHYVQIYVRARTCVHQKGAKGV